MSTPLNHSLINTGQDTTQENHIDSSGTASAKKLMVYAETYLFSKDCGKNALYSLSFKIDTVTGKVSHIHEDPCPYRPTPYILLDLVSRLIRSQPHLAEGATVKYLSRIHTPSCPAIIFPNNICYYLNCKVDAKWLKKNDLVALVSFWDQHYKTQDTQWIFWVQKAG